VSVVVAVTLLSLAAWIGMLFFRGGFWRADQRLGDQSVAPDRWPTVAAIIPARDEAQTVGAAVSSLLALDYPGSLSVTVVDDGSSDGTGAAAVDAGGGDPRLRVVSGSPLRPGWTGKLWAVSQGIEHAARTIPDAEFYLLTDADIVHHPQNLRRLVGKAADDGLDLVSLMVLLRCESFWERLLIPAFVFFFQKLFPFPWVNDRRRRTAAAAGGCMLVRVRALEQIGGIGAIRGRLIDDCALAGLLKRNGGIWLGLTPDTLSLRRYDRLAPIWRMVARSAFEQLNNSSVLLAGTLVGMAILYLMPAVGLVWGSIMAEPVAVFGGSLAWLAMVLAYRPTVRLYRLHPPWALSLPLAALLYTVFTIDSAYRHWIGAAGAWKGRTYPRRMSGKE